MSSLDEQELIFEDDIAQEVEFDMTEIEVNRLIRSPLLMPQDRDHMTPQRDAAYYGTSIANELMNTEGEWPSYDDYNRQERSQQSYDIPRGFSGCMQPLSSIVEHMAETNYKLWLHSKN